MQSDEDALEENMVGTIAAIVYFCCMSAALVLEVRKSKRDSEPIDFLRSPLIWPILLIAGLLLFVIIIIVIGLIAGF
jgi:hypothetical protein